MVRARVAKDNVAPAQGFIVRDDYGGLRVNFCEWAHPLMRSARYKCVYGGRASGKALRSDTPITTPDGWTEIGKLNVGDLVFGTDGYPVRVAGVFPQGPREMWKVSFRHGEPIYADADHLWRMSGREYPGWTEAPARTTRELARCLWGGEPLLVPASPLTADTGPSVHVVESIERTGARAEAVCISVDASDSMFLAGRSRIPTHNTWTVAHMLILQAMEKPIRTACCREFGSSIAFSSALALQGAIHRMGLTTEFSIYDDHIVGRNGSFFFFRGLERNRESIKGWEDVDRVWVEEAQTLSAASANLLTPTIRKTGSEIWLTWNPRHRTDWAYRRFITNPVPEDVVLKVNWNMNPGLSKEADDERLYCKEYNPDMYSHIWQGMPDDVGGDKRVLPYALASKCVKAFSGKIRDRYRNLYHDGGLDVADSGEGGGWNAFVVRRAPVITHAERWQKDFTGDTARAVDFYARNDQVMSRIYYDAQGVGAGVATTFEDLRRQSKDGTPYTIWPEFFGGKVKGKQRMFSHKTPNDMFFSMRNSQMAWALRLRAENTKKLLNKVEGINIDRCLFIDPDVGSIEHYLEELSQPTWEYANNGKIRLMKRGKGEASPDLFDATCLAFARDSENGLVAR